LTHAEAEAFAAWFALLHAEGVGRSTARELLAAFGGPQEVLAAPRAVVRERFGAKLADSLARRPDQHAERLAAALAWWRGGAPGERHVLVLGDEAYPERLLHTADPPLLLYAQGDLACLARPAVAIVGSRQATPQGLDHARRFARALAQAGVCVVSGLASGIDGAAHEGALDVAEQAGATGLGGTVAVVGTGLDRVYPPRHLKLAHRIGQHGLLLSEYPPGMPALAAHFPERNRIIAALSLGTLVVEAALRSGSLITARLAAEAGREVYAVPGSLHAEQSRGCHALIREGALLVESPEDILVDLAPRLGPRPARAGSGATQGASRADSAQPEDPLLALLGTQTLTLDELSARSGAGIGELAARLLELELQGQVAALPGGRFQRLFSA
jgi:DNA processing protein